MSVLLRIIFVAFIFVLVGCAAVRITSESGHAEDVSVSEIIGEPLWIPAHSFDERSFPRNQFIGDLKQVTLFKSVAVYDVTSCCKNRIRDEVIENSRQEVFLIATTQQAPDINWHMKHHEIRIK